MFGTGARARTSDRLGNNQLLYQLSYPGVIYLPFGLGFDAPPDFIGACFPPAYGFFLAATARAPWR